MFSPGKNPKTFLKKLLSQQEFPIKKIVILWVFYPKTSNPNQFLVYLLQLLLLFPMNHLLTLIYF